MNSKDADKGMEGRDAGRQEHRHISKRTLFYIRKYGPRGHIVRVVVKESLKILILASVISSLGGIMLQSVSEKILVLMPLIILLPALNGMIGNYGAVVSSKFTTMLYLGRVRKRWWWSPDVKPMFKNVFAVSLISSVYIGAMSSVLAHIMGFGFELTMFLKVVAVAVLSTILLVALISLISILGGLFIYRRNEDPNNFLIPIATSIADFGSITVLSVFAILIF